MNSMRRAWMRLRGTLSREGLDNDLANEMETHILMQTEDNLRRGMSPQEARRGALLKFGGVDQTREAYRDQRGFRLIDNLRLDIRVALRMLLRSPSVSIPVILVLAVLRK
jgi:hypothetical protein